MSPKVTAILVARAGGEHLSQTLKALSEQTRAPDTLVVVDNGSRGSVASDLRSAPAHKLITMPGSVPFGEAIEMAARTAALERGENDVLWFLGQDSAPAPTALERLLGALEVSPSVAIVGPKQMEWDRPDYSAEYGLTMTRRDAAQRATTRVTTAWGDVASVTDAAGGQTRYQHDAAGRLTQVVDAYNRQLAEGADIREEWKRSGLEESRRREEADAARARAQLEQFNKELEESARLGEDLGLVFESAFSKLGGDFKAGDVFKSLVTDITQVIYKMLILTPIIERVKKALSSANSGGGFSMESLLGSLFGGARAMGGPVSAGSGYLVGEQGPEFFIPSVSGTIVPNGMGGVTVIQNVSVDARSDIASVRQAMAAAKSEAVYEVQQQLARRGAIARA
jgi:YD repeat-containing protein